MPESLLNLCKKPTSSSISAYHSWLFKCVCVTATMRYAEMPWTEIHRLDRKTLFLLTVSPMEEHGPHLPVGTDWLISLALEERIVDALLAEMSVVTLPPLPVGTCRMTSDIPGSMSLNWKTVRDIVLEVLLSLKKQGFTNVMLLTFHMDLHHIKAIQAAITYANAAGMNVCEPLSGHYFRGTLLPPIDGKNEVHADMKETSLGLVLFPDLVQNHKKLRPVNISLKRPKALLQTMREMGAEQGYVGNPAMATIDYGRKAINQVTAICIATARSLLQKKDTPTLPPRIKLLLHVI
jgi:creatinine amidohydrolase